MFSFHSHQLLLFDFHNTFSERALAPLLHNATILYNIKSFNIFISCAVKSVPTNSRGLEEVFSVVFCSWLSSSCFSFKSFVSPSRSFVLMPLTLTCLTRSLLSCFCSWFFVFSCNSPRNVVYRWVYGMEAAHNYHMLCISIASSNNHTISVRFVIEAYNILKDKGESPNRECRRTERVWSEWAEEGEYDARLFFTNRLRCIADVYTDSST